MLFVTLCQDKPNSVELRKATRPAHLKYLNTLGDHLQLAGPVMNKAGDPCGSLIVAEFESGAAAEAFAKEDPYVKAGLFQLVTILPWTVGLGRAAEALKIKD